MYEEDVDQPPSNIGPAFLRYKWHLLLGIPVLLIVTLAIVLALPPVYRAQGTVMVETQQIPVDLVQSTITTAAMEQIDIIRQRVMTRENLLQIIRKYPYLGSVDASPLETQRVLNQFRSAISLDIASTQKGRDLVAIGFNLSFGSRSPAISQAVTNDLVNLFLSENVKARTARASETTDFLSASADRIRQELDSIEAKVADFKRENKDALPEHLNLYIGMREDTRKRLSDINQSIRAYTDQINLMQSQLSLAREQSGSLSGAETDLATLRDEYKRLQLNYTSEHPEVVLLREKITLLEQGDSDTDAPRVYSSAELAVVNQIASLKTQVDHLQIEKDNHLEKLADIEERIIRIPQVERGFVSIQRDYEAKLAQYERIITKTQNAEMAENLEHERKAERFTLLEPPMLPSAPAEPERQKILAMGVFMSLSLPMALVILLGFMDRSIRTASALEKYTGAAPLIEIPIVHTTQERQRHRQRLRYLLLGAACILLATTVLIHLLVMPVNLIAMKIAARFGV